jgi:hypothetical protein
MTKDTAEEKIVQIGRKKMALDQALIESMGAEDDAGVDLESILKHGAEALFNDDDRNDIHYDSASVDKLLDRTKVENTNSGEQTQESQFSFARVWANDKGTLTEDLGDDSEPSVPNFSVWDKILKQREADAAAEAARNMQTFGRGKRARQVSSSRYCKEFMLTQRKTVDYQKNVDLDDEMPDSSPLKVLSKRHPDESASDLDFAAAGESDGDDDSDIVGEVDPRELQPQQERSRGSTTTPPKGKSTPPKKVISAQTKGSTIKKPASTVTSIKKQQGSVKKTTAPPKSSGKSTQTAPNSSNKTVGSKKLEDVKAQKVPRKIQNGAKVKPTNSANFSEVKKKVPVAKSVPKPVVGKDTKEMQPKKQEVTAIKQSVPSASQVAKPTNLGSANPNLLPAKPANAVKAAPNTSKKIVPAESISQKTKVKPDATVKTASAGNQEPVASKTTKAPQTSKPASSASPDSSPRSESSNSAVTSSSMPTLQMANSKPQTTDTTPQATTQNSTAPYKKNPSSLSLPTSAVQTQSTPSSVAVNSTKMDLDTKPGLKQSQPTMMELDHDMGQMQAQPTNIDLDNDLAEIQPPSIQVDMLSGENETAPRTLRFSLQSEMADLVAKIRQSSSAISAKADTSVWTMPQQLMGVEHCSIVWRQRISAFLTNVSITA